MVVANTSTNGRAAPKFKETLPKGHDNNITRIKHRLGGGATAAEVASEAYRVCRINGYPRRDLQQARDEIRQNRDNIRKQAVQQDALSGMRRELHATLQMLDHVRELLAQRKVKIPEDMKAEYAALKLRDPHDWQPKKGVKLQRAAVKKARKTETPITKAQRKAEKKAMEQKKQKRNKQTEFILHMPDGEAYDARKPIIVADDPDEEEGEDEDMTAEDAAAIELANFMKNGSSYRPLSRSQSPD